MELCLLHRLVDVIDKHIIKNLYLIALGFLLAFVSNAQSVSLDTSAVNPTKGTIIYDDHVNLLKYWNGTAWISIQNGASGTGWVLNGDDIHNNNSGNVGIGTNTPTHKLDINTGENGISGVGLRKLLGEVNSEIYSTTAGPVGLTRLDGIALFVTDFTGNKINKISTSSNSGDITLFLGSVLNGTHDIIVGPDFFLYVSNFWGNNVLRINPTSAASTVYA